MEESIRVSGSQRLPCFVKLPRRSGANYYKRMSLTNLQICWVYPWDARLCIDLGGKGL